jgi:hypothetical protein
VQVPRNRGNTVRAIARLISCRRTSRPGLAPLLLTIQRRLQASPPTSTATLRLPGSGDVRRGSAYRLCFGAKSGDVARLSAMWARLPVYSQRMQGSAKKAVDESGVKRLLCTRAPTSSSAYVAWTSSCEIVVAMHLEREYWSGIQASSTPGVGAHRPQAWCSADHD